MLLRWWLGLELGNTQSVIWWWLTLPLPGRVPPRAGTTLPTSKAALEVLYQSRIATSKKLSFVANAPSRVLTEAQLGAFPANR